jgi:hypothetical protein
MRFFTAKIPSIFCHIDAAEDGGDFFVRISGFMNQIRVNPLF